MRARLFLLIQLYYNPAAAVTGIRASSPYISGALLGALTSFVYYSFFNGNLLLLKALFTAPDPSAISSALVHRLLGAFSPLLFLAAVFVPAAILVATLIDRRASFSVVFRQEYAPMASCVFYAWAAAHLIMLAPVWAIFGNSFDDPQAIPPILQLCLRLAPLPYFIFVSILAVRTVLRQSYAKSLGVVLLATCSLVALPLLPNLLFLFSSPFMLIIALLFLRGFIGDIFTMQRDRERFKQNLEAATLNPADSSAHYNLGLIYQQRGQFDEARQSFERAVEIAPDETDAHYQLGRLAREQGRLPDAIRHFDAVVALDQEHSLSEVWREIGRAYFQAGQFEDAKGALDRFLEKRPTDAEGRYYYALALANLGRTAEAAEQMRVVIESVRTSPAYKYRAERRWMSEAESFLRSLST